MDRWKLLESHNISQLEELGKAIVKLRKQLKAACIVLLDGPMGAGKTEFVKRFAHNLGLTETASPSFAIHHLYKDSVTEIHHFDLYRLENEADLESTGFWDILQDFSGWVFVEWPQRLDEKMLPRTTRIYKVKFHHSQDSTRRIDVLALVES